MKNSFILFNDYYEKLKGLTDEQMGKLFRAILAAQNGEELTFDDIAVRMAYEFIAVDIEKHNKAYEERCKTNSENGKKGGRPSKANKANETEKSERFLEKQTQPKKANESEKSRYDMICYDMNIYIDIISYLNKVVGAKYSEKSQYIRRLIDARLHDGYTLDDFKRVIDIKAAEWLHTEMEQYLRPQTLFGTKFEAYLNQRPAKRRIQEFDERQYANGELETLVDDPLAELIKTMEDEENARYTH